MHGANRLGGNSLSDLLVFGRRAGLYAAEYAEARQAARRRSTTARSTQRRGACSRRSTATGSENPYTHPRRPRGLHAEPGRHHPHRVRAGAGAGRRSTKLKERAGARHASRATASTTRAGTWRSICTRMLTVSEAITAAALERKESRGGHTRDDFPDADPQFAQGERGDAAAPATA